MTILGEIALWIALPVALWGTAVSFIGGRCDRSDLVLSGERTVHVLTLLILLASIGISAAFVGNRYEYSYVANYSNRELETYFKVAGLWAGQRGSLVFWTLLLSVFSSIAVFLNRARNREFMPYVSGTLLGLLAFSPRGSALRRRQPLRADGIHTGERTRPQSAVAELLDDHSSPDPVPRVHRLRGAVRLCRLGSPHRSPRLPLDRDHATLDTAGAGSSSPAASCSACAGPTRSWAGEATGSGIPSRTPRCFPG